MLLESKDTVYGAQRQEKLFLSRYITFDEFALTNKVTLEEAKQIDGASKQVEFEGKIIFPTQGSNEETAENFPLEGEPVEEEVLSQEPQPQLESIATGKPKKTIRKSARLIDMVDCADSIAADDILPLIKTQSKVHKKISGGLPWMKKCSPFIRIIHGDWSIFRRARKQLGANGYLQRKKDFLTKKMSATKQDWWPKDMLKRREFIIMRCFLQL